MARLIPLANEAGNVIPFNGAAVVPRRDVLIADIRLFTLSYAAGLVFFTFFFG